MNIPSPLRRFSDDQRAVSAVVGFILVFGLLTLSLAVYQAQVVPQQNAQTEFEHFEQNQDELVEFRNAISTAGQSKVSQFPSVKLGTLYQSRTFTINPAPPSGSLQTSQPYNITLEDETGTTENVSTRFVEYRPGYREVSVGSTWYEHSVLYLDERESSGLNIIEDQNIVSSSGTVRITALQNEFQSTRTDRVTLELYPTNDSEFPDLEGEVEVKLPTRLDEDYWEPELGPSIYEDIDSYPGEPGVNRLILEVDSDDLQMNTVGIQDEPTEGSVDNVPVGGGGENGEEGTEVNPAGPGDVRLVGVNNEGGGTVILTFRNNGEDTNIDSGRVGFYTGSGEDIPNEVTISVPNEEDTRATWTIGDGFISLDPPIMLDSSEDTEVEYEFDQNYNTNQDFFVTTLEFNNNEQGTYFVGGEYDPDDPEVENGEETFSYDISIDDTDLTGSNLDVTFDASTNDGDATVEVQSSLNSDEIDSETFDVASEQPQTERVDGKDGGDDATSVRVTLFDGDGNEQANDTQSIN